MYLSLRQVQVVPARVDEIMRRAQATFVPIIRESPGFVAFYAVELGGGTIASLSVFQDKAGADASVQLAADHSGRTFAELFPNPPRVMAGEVRVAVP